jgi:hypothetical protein
MNEPPHPSGVPSSLEREIRRFDAELKRLIEVGVDMSGPGWFERFKARQAEMRESREEKEKVRSEADQLLPELLDLYLGGSDVTRGSIRALLAQCRWFRWSLGWNLARKEAMTEDELRRILALFSMKDQGSDWRDAIVWLHGICRRAAASGMDLAGLLREAARRSADVSPFNGRPSTRQMMFDYASRAEGGSH